MLSVLTSTLSWHEQPVGVSWCWQRTLYLWVHIGNAHEQLAWSRALQMCWGNCITLHLVLVQICQNALGDTFRWLPDGVRVLSPRAGVLQQLLPVLPHGQQLAALIIYLTEEAAAAQEGDHEQALPAPVAAQWRGSAAGQAVARQLEQVKGPAVQPLVSLYLAACKVVEQDSAPVLEQQPAQSAGADDVTAAPASGAEQAGGRIRQAGSKRSAAALSPDSVGTQGSDDDGAAARHKKRKGQQSAGGSRGAQQEAGPAAGADDIEQLLSEATDHRW